MRILIALIALALACTSAKAADLTVMVKDRAGHPVRDAVVTLFPAGGAAHAPIKFPWTYEVDQRNKAFLPFVQIVPVGSDVTFHNRDPFRHQVYSFSKPHPFELKLFGAGEVRTDRFDAPGSVALGCNIHDQMIGFIKVVDTPLAAKTGDDGQAVLRGVPAGKGVLKVWHPYLQANGNEIALDVTAPAAAPIAVTVGLQPPPPPPSMHDGMEGME
jgi:plastocyanin